MAADWVENTRVDSWPGGDLWQKTQKKQDTQTSLPASFHKDLAVSRAQKSRIGIGMRLLRRNAELPQSLIEWCLSTGARQSCMYSTYSCAGAKALGQANTGSWENAR